MIIAIYSILQWRPRKVGIRALSLHPILSRKQFRKVRPQKKIKFITANFRLTCSFKYDIIENIKRD